APALRAGPALRARRAGPARRVLPAVRPDPQGPLTAPACRTRLTALARRSPGAARAPLDRRRRRRRLGGRGTGTCRAGATGRGPRSGTTADCTVAVRRL